MTALMDPDHRFGTPIRTYLNPMLPLGNSYDDARSGIAEPNLLGGIVCAQSDLACKAFNRGDMLSRNLAGHFDQGKLANFGLAGFGSKVLRVKLGALHRRN